MKAIHTVGVVGAGTMGSALAQKFIQEGFRVILADRDETYVLQGLKRISDMLSDGEKQKVFTTEQVRTFLDRISTTTSLDKLQECDLIIEAIYEDFNAKCELLKILSSFVSPTTILATNTSSFSVTDLSASVSYPERFIGLHYFYHAAKNRLVEIIPGKHTHPATLNSVKKFSALSGKDAIITKDKYGFAINRFFVPWLNEAVKLLEEGIGSIVEIDTICKKTFGIGMGPFELMNVTGIPIALHAQKTLEAFGTSYKVSALLVEQVKKKLNWNIPAASTQIINEDLERKVVLRMTGVVFFICSQILEEGVCSATDLNKGAKIGLKWRKGPVDLMIKAGTKEVEQIVDTYARQYGVKPPIVSSDLWKQEFILINKIGGHAILTFNRPEELNALNEEVIKQLEACFSEAEWDPSIHTIFITGTGKAFVAGADIKFFVKNIKNHSLEKIIDFTRFGHSVFEKIDVSSKKVVVILNGLTLGGGLELALCGDVILAVDKATMAFPETGIGIYPGLGGTQRTQKRIGKGLTKYMILTGKTLSAKEAEEIGIVDAIISAEDLFDITEGTKPIPTKMIRTLPAKWKAYADLFSENSFTSIISHQCQNSRIEQTELNHIGKLMGYKAPIAMHIAEELIEKGMGPSSELDKLNSIFSTNDALLGLSSIGTKVVFTGQ